VTPRRISRRAFLAMAAGAAALGLEACTSATKRSAPSTGPTGNSLGPTTASSSAPESAPTTAPPGPPTPSASPFDCDVDPSVASGTPLWKIADGRGLMYGSSTATWQISDKEYRALYERQAGILFTEDDLLWYRLRPKPNSDLDFTYGDRIVEFAHRNGMNVFGAHLVWDDGFGPGWKRSELFSMSKADAERLLHGTLDAAVRRYRGKVQAWSVVNEAVDGSGLRTDYPWYRSIGPQYLAESFHRARAADPDALLVLNDYGFETDDVYGNSTADKRAAMLRVLDDLLSKQVPVDALGVQAHLDATMFPSEFDPVSYRTFLSDVADRGLKILITELDVLDDTLPAAACPRDSVVADAYRQLLDAALDEPAVVSLMTFGLSDRYTWLQEDYPRDDGAPRRPLPFDDDLQPKAAFVALRQGLERAPVRRPFWRAPRASKLAAG